MDTASRRGRRSGRRSSTSRPLPGRLRPVLFLDAGQAGGAGTLFSGRVLAGAGVGLSVFGGLLRFDLSRAVSPDDATVGSTSWCRERGRLPRVTGILRLHGAQLARLVAAGLVGAWPARPESRPIPAPARSRWSGPARTPASSPPPPSPSGATASGCWSCGRSMATPASPSSSIPPAPVGAPTPPADSAHPGHLPGDPARAGRLEPSLRRRRSALVRGDLHPRLPRRQRHRGARGHRPARGGTILRLPPLGDRGQQAHGHRVVQGADRHSRGPRAAPDTPPAATDEPDEPLDELDEPDRSAESAD